MMAVDRRLYRLIERVPATELRPGDMLVLSDRSRLRVRDVEVDGDEVRVFTAGVYPRGSTPTRHYGHIFCVTSTMFRRERAS